MKPSQDTICLLLEFLQYKHRFSINKYPMKHQYLLLEILIRHFHVQIHERLFQSSYIHSPIVHLLLRFHPFLNIDESQLNQSFAFQFVVLRLLQSKIFLLHMSVIIPYWQYLFSHKCNQILLQLLQHLAQPYIDPQTLEDLTKQILL